MQNDSPSVASDETPHQDEHMSLLHQILENLKTLPGAHKVAADDRAKFWKMYEKEASSYDDEFLEKHHKSLDIVLIFAGLFSAINTGFLNSLQSELSPDPNTMTHTLLRILISTINNSTVGDTDLSLPAWTGPGASTIRTQSCLYASLSLCLLSALGAMLGKQWLEQYARVDVGGTADDRRRSRQRKRDALRVWHFTTVLEALSALLQIALLIFGIGVGTLLWNQQHVIAGVVVGAMTLGGAFYLLILIAAVVSPDCPFRTPTSDIFRHFLQSKRKIVQDGLWELGVTVGMAKQDSGCVTTMVLQHVVDPILDAILRPEDTLLKILGGVG
ncbi:hypothetical protein FRC01_003351 [Tulasnella sp. 417]|nr:hypothetical protein FRC01_003351 [Tulasnella sp. 417]